MKFKPTLVAVAVSTLAVSVQAQVFANREAETQTKFLSAVGAPQAWARGITGKGVIIGIVDNGFDVNHSDLNGKVIVNPDKISNPTGSLVTNVGY